MKKLLLLFLSVLLVFCFPVSNICFAANYDEHYLLDNPVILQNIVARLMINDIQKAVDDYYLEYLTDSPQIEVYAPTSSTKITSVSFDSENNLYVVIIEVEPYVGAHNPIGRDRIVFEIYGYGKSKVRKFEHLESFEIVPWLKDLQKKPFPKDTYRAAINIGYYEIEVDDMVDCSLFSYFPNRSWIGNPIKLKYGDENVNFNCTVDKGVFSPSSQYVKNITLKSGDGFHWLPYELDQKGELTSKNKIERAFVEIILKTDENIIGYTLVEMYPITEYCFSFKAKTLKSAIFPKVEGRCQSVSEEQVKEIINKIKTNNEG